MIRLAELRRNAFEQHDVRARGFQRLGAVEHALGGRFVATLHPEAAGLVHRLRLQPQVRAHRDVVAREEFDDLELAEPAFELDHFRAAFLHEAHGIRQRDVGRRIARERQIGHEERPMQAARHRFAVIDDVVHGHRHGGVVTLQDHAQRIAHQHQVGVGVVAQHREAGVVAGDARDLLVLALHPVERAQRDRRPRRIALFEMRVQVDPSCSRVRLYRGGAGCNTCALSSCAGSHPPARRNRPGSAPDRCWPR